MSTAFEALKQKTALTSPTPKVSAFDALKERQSKINPTSVQTATPAPEPTVKGGMAGELFTGNTQRFGKTIGESLAAPGNADKYAESLQQHTQIQNNLLKAIKTKKELGQDTTRLQDALENHIENTPKLRDFTGDVIDKTTKQIVGEGVGTGLEAVSGGLLSSGAKTVVSKSVPTLTKLGQSAKIGATYGGIAGASNAMQNNTGVVEGTVKGALMGGAVGLGAGTLGAVIPKVPKIIKGVTPDASRIMQRVARVSKSKQANFEKQAGESIGEYLTKRDIYGNIDEISDKLYKRFETSKSAADEALASLPGRYKSQPLKTALDELASREGRVSSPGAPSRDLKRVNELVNKYEAGGLEMKEINEAKRLYERNVKLDFLKQNLPESVARANNIDDALRAWQFEQADKLGLKNLPALNKETRLAKQLLNDIGQEYAGSAGNNAITLTDWIVLSGGDPTAIGAFFAKRALLSKGVQSKFARAIGPKASVGMPKAEFGGKSGVPALIPGRDYRVPMEMRPPKSPSTIEKPAQKIFNQSQIDNQLKLPAPRGGKSQGEPIKLPVSARESTLGLNEVKNTVTPTQTNRTPKLLPKLSPKKLNKTLPKIVSQKSDKSSDVLVNEAKKYKSAEEFVKRQPLVYHGSRVPLKKFDNKKGGVYFTDEYADATGFGGSPDNVYEGYLNFKKPLVIDAKGAKWDELNTKYGKSTQEIVSNAQKEGYDGVTFKNIVDNIMDTADEGGQTTIHYAYKPQDSFLNESQLTDIWKKTNNQKGSVNVKSLGIASAVTGGGIALGNLLKKPSAKSEYDSGYKKPRPLKITGDEKTKLIKTLKQLESSGGKDKSNADEGEVKWLTGLTQLAIDELKRTGIKKSVDINDEADVLDASIKYFELMQKRNPSLSPAEVYVDRYWTQAKNPEQRKKKIEEFNRLMNT